jgi:FAD/FMN-containing dehydrogenase/Fe-S oxidoreductase
MTVPAPKAPAPLTPPPGPEVSEADLTRAYEELRGSLMGEVRFDEAARVLYATDASPYEIKPYGVVLPKTREDIRRTLEVARRYKLPVLPRGGGTSLAGQTVGRAIVVDVSKYLDRVLEFSETARTVKVEPGVVRDNLNLYLKPFKLQFTPDVSTTNRANIGGMVANNSAGTRSIKYGKTVDQVVSMTVMLADGTVTEFRELTGAELHEKLRAPGLEGEIYRTVHRLVREHEAEIHARFPKVMRRVGGYNLDELTGDKPFNLAKLVAGSEGTLAFILDVTLRLSPIPAHKCLALLHFDTLEKSLRAVQHINHHGPSAVETLDDTLLELGLQNPNLAPLLSWLQGRPAAVLMVEFDGESEQEMLAGLQSLQADPTVAELAYALHVAYGPQEQAEVWEVRKGGLGVFNTMKGAAKPVPLIEDAAIPPESLAEYIPAVAAICAKHGVKMVSYGHASVGVIHVRPVLDLKTREGIEAFRKISEETFELVRRYGGSWSGEHGDGLIRSYKNRELFGDTLYEAFRELKRAFDPEGLFNPGKIVDAPPITDNLRYGEGYTALPIATHFDFSKDDGFMGAIEMCTGVGACRKTTTGTMCPSYMVTRDEEHSTRGRANLLRDAMNGRLSGGLTSREVYDALDLCLECKACKAECPSRVDMAKLKYEFLQHFYDAHGTPLSARVLGHAATVAPVGRFLAPLANALLPLAPVRWLMEKTAGIDRRRVMPPYANASFHQWVARRETRREEAHAPERPKVALFADTWTMYNEPEVGVAATEVLEALGYAVEHVRYRCCGRPQISKGLLREAKALARRNVAALQTYVARGVPVVGLEPSCVAAFQDDYRDLVPGEATEAVAGHVKMIDQFLAKAWTKGELEPGAVFHKNGAHVMLHGHCQQRAIQGTASTKAVLGWVSDNVFEVDSGCCGMAGSFGYGHFELSMQIGERRLFPAVREHDGETVACGFSCRHQIRDGTGRRAKHLTQLLAEALPPASRTGNDEDGTA